MPTRITNTSNMEENSTDPSNTLEVPNQVMKKNGNWSAPELDPLMSGKPLPSIWKVDMSLTTEEFIRLETTP